MVSLSKLLLANNSVTMKKARGRGWIDTLRVYVKGGTGGAGLPPVDGVGGQGGSVWVRATEKIGSLHEVRRKNQSQRYVADGGEDSSRVKCMGENGQDVVIRSPIGVTVTTDSGEVLGDLVKDDDSVLVARGGPGGSRHTQYCGLRGQARSVKLDLKLIADVGFVGFPNAGKSTLLKAISRASPKIASYPFTTLEPKIGVVEFPDLRRMKLADLPGLIEGASDNQGMGHKFLKHVERCSLLLFIVDINGFQFKVDTQHRSAAETELELYKSELIHKPAVLALTKMDSEGSEQLLESFHEELKVLQSEDNTVLCKFDEIVPISAKFSGKSVDILKYSLRQWLDEHHSKTTEGNIEKLEKHLQLSDVRKGFL